MGGFAHVYIGILCKSGAIRGGAVGVSTVTMEGLMRVKVAIGLVVAFLATMLSVGPASAQVRVIVRANGDVLINGDGAGNTIDVVFCGDGLAVVLVEGEEGYEVVPVEDDLTVNLKGGNDNLRISSRYIGDDAVGAEEFPEDCLFRPEVDAANGGPYDVPGNLKVLGASGNDTVSIRDVSIGKDLTTSLSSGDNNLFTNYIHVGDDVTVRASGGRDRVEMYGFWINDRLDLNLSAGNNNFYFSDGSTARAIIRGHNGDDRIRTGNGGSGDPVDFGHNPIIIGAGGGDEVRLSNFTWSGKLRLNTGSGGDDIFLDLEPDGGNGLQVEDSGILDLDTGSGDDFAMIFGGLIDGDDLNGGPGFDELRLGEEPDAGSIKNFEIVGPAIS